LIIIKFRNSEPIVIEAPHLAFALGLAFISGVLCCNYWRVLRLKKQKERVEKENLAIKRRRRRSSIILGGEPAEEKDHQRMNSFDEEEIEKKAPTINLGSPLKKWSSTTTTTSNCWSDPPGSLFKVRGKTYVANRKKVHSGDSAFKCIGTELWLTRKGEEAMSNVGRHPAMLGGKLRDQPSTLIINFMMPWGNLVSYFEIPSSTTHTGVANSWRRFLGGGQKYRDAHLKLLPVVVEGPWICRQAIGAGNAPAVVGKALPLEYHEHLNNDDGLNNKGKYFEVDLQVSASAIARGILGVVKSHTKSITIDLAFIIEGTEEDELPENVLAAFRLHELDPSLAMEIPVFEDEGTGAKDEADDEKEKEVEH
jgi:hypothetical protein